MNPAFTSKTDASLEIDRFDLDGWLALSIDSMRIPGKMQMPKCV